MLVDSQKTITVKVHLFMIFVLSALAVLVFLPVLIHPHWGTFDDALFIIQRNHFLQFEPSSLFDSSKSMRATFGLFVTALWRLFPENPRGFYATNCLIFCGTLSLTYLNAFLLSRNVKFSALSAGLFFFAPGLFEVIYALDKQESYLSFLCALAITLFILISRNGRQTPILLTLFVLDSACIFLTKESGAILLIMAFSFLGIAGIQHLLARGDTLKGAQWKQSVKLTLAVFLTYALLRLYYEIFFPSISHYVIVSFDFHKIIAKLLTYACSMPFYFSTLISAIAYGSILLGRRKRNLDCNFNLFLVLVLSVSAATLAVSAFDSFQECLLYIWLPIYSFLLPAFSFLLSDLFQSPIRISKYMGRSLLVVSAVVICLELPDHFASGQFQFAFDALTSKLTAKLEQVVRNSPDNVIGAMPTFNLGSSELPEEIELLVRFKLEPGFYNRGYEKAGSHRFAMFNFLGENCFDLPARSRLGAFCLGKLLGNERFYKNECPFDFVGWTGYQIFTSVASQKQNQDYSNCVKRPFGKGCLLIVPVGNLHIDGVGYRGASLFTTDLNTRLLSFPQLTFEEIGRVDSKIFDTNLKPLMLGWRVLKVKTAQAVSLPIERLDCWLQPGDRLYYENSDNSNLQIVSRQAVDDSWQIKDCKGTTRPLVWRKQDGQSLACVNLPMATDKICWIELQQPDRLSKKLLHIDRVELTAGARP